MHKHTPPRSNPNPNTNPNSNSLKPLSATESSWQSHLR